MPAAAVIPAPIAYIKVVAVKKLVVGFLVLRPWSAGLTAGCVCRGWVSSSRDAWPALYWVGPVVF